MVCKSLKRLVVVRDYTIDFPTLDKCLGTIHMVDFRTSYGFSNYAVSERLDFGRRTQSLNSLNATSTSTHHVIIPIPPPRAHLVALPRTNAEVFERKKRQCGVQGTSFGLASGSSPHKHE